MTSMTRSRMMTSGMTEDSQDVSWEEEVRIGHRFLAHTFDLFFSTIKSFTLRNFRSKSHIYSDLRSPSGLEQ